MKTPKLLLALTLLATTAWADSVTPTITPTAKPTKPSHLVTVKLFTDKKEATYVQAYPTETSKTVVIFKKNKRWVDVKLKGTDKGGIYMGVDVKDLAPYLEKGALQFYIRGDQGGETLSSVGFRMGKDEKNKFNFTSTVPLGNYCLVTTKWQVVTIPLSEFPLTGKYTEVDEVSRRLQRILNHPITDSTDQHYVGRFDWNKVIEMEFEHDSDFNGDMEIEISNIVILPSYKLRTVVREKEAIQ